MKIPVLIVVYIVLNTVNAELKIFNKSVSRLYTNPIAVTTPKLPQDRRKQSFFPKKLAKYVVTSKPYSNVRKYTPRPILMTKISLFKPHFIKESTTVQYKPVTRIPLMKSMEFTMEPPKEQIPRQIVDRRDNKIGISINKDKFKKIKYNNEEKNRDYEKSVMNIEDDFEISTDIDNIEGELHSSDIISNLSKVKRSSSIEGIGIFNYWTNLYIPSDASNEMIDENEFIFLKKSTNKPQNKPKNRSDDIEGKIANLKSTDYKSRLKRNNNIIEEENLGTTISGYEYTGREHDSRIHSDLVFKNIHA